jgi:hypothetical protein
LSDTEVCPGLSHMHLLREFCILIFPEIELNPHNVFPIQIFLREYGDGNVSSAQQRKMRSPASLMCQKPNTTQGPARTRHVPEGVSEHDVQAC